MSHAVVSTPSVNVMIFCREGITFNLVFQHQASLGAEFDEISEFFKMFTFNLTKIDPKFLASGGLQVRSRIDIPSKHDRSTKVYPDQHNRSLAQDLRKAHLEPAFFDAVLVIVYCCCGVGLLF